MGSVGHVNVGREAVVWGSLISVHTGRLEENANVKGMAMVGDSLILEPGASVDTTIVEHATDLQACPIPTLPKISTGSDPLNIPSGPQHNLAPGKYGDVWVYPEGTLHLTSGAYNFQSLRLDSLAALTFDLTGGPIQINVEGYLFVGLESEIVQVAGDTSETMTLYTNQIDPLFIQSLAGVTGSFVAPHASILVGDSVEVVGRLFGKNVTLGAGAMVFKGAGPKPTEFPPPPEIPSVLDTTVFFDSLLSQITPGQTSPTWTQIRSSPSAPPAYGVIGDAERQFAQKMNMGWYEIYGNHSLDSNKNPNLLIMSLQPNADPIIPGMNMVRKIATIEARNDSHRYGQKEFGEDLVDFALERAGYHVWPIKGCWETITFPCIRRWRFRLCKQRVPSLCLRDDPKFRIHKPKADEMVAADRMQILDAIQRDIAAGRSGKTILEIGNEPNLFPFILPQDYAEMVRAYYQLIKQADPNAVVAFGSLFDIDFMKPDAREELNQIASTGILLAGAGLFIGGIAAGLILGPAATILVWLALPLAITVFDEVRDLIRDDILFKYSTREYFSLVLDNLEPSVKPEAISVHYYPFDIEGQYSRNEILGHMAYTSGWLSADLYQDRGQFSPIVVTETGNINWELNNEADVLPRMVDILDGGEYGVYPGGEQPIVNFNAMMLWYKPLSIDKKFNGLADIPVIGIDTPPFTRFINDEAVDVGNVQRRMLSDGWSSFCTDINSLGHEYFQRINGAACGSP